MGYVYVIGLEHSSLVKIGQTEQDPLKRMRSLQTGLPYTLKMLKVYECEHAATIERRMHTMLQEQRHQREWFDASLQEVDAVFLTACQPVLLPEEPPCLSVQAHMGRMMKARRKLLGMSQEGLATATDIPQEHISRYERGAFHAINPLRLVAIANVLQMTVNDLLNVDT